VATAVGIMAVVIMAVAMVVMVTAAACRPHHRWRLRPSLAWPVRGVEPSIRQARGFASSAEDPWSLRPVPSAEPRYSPARSFALSAARRPPDSAAAAWLASRRGAKAASLPRGLNA